MGRVVKLNEHVQLPSRLQSDTPELRLARLSNDKRVLSEARLTFLEEAMDKHAALGMSRSKCIQWLLSRAKVDQLSDSATRALSVIGKVPGKATVHRWWAAVESAQSNSEKLLNLVDERKGRQRKPEGWELRATELYNRPTKPHMSTVAIWLQQEGWDVKPQTVRRFLKALPAQLGEHGVKRMGRHYYNQNLRPYVVRDVSTLPVGLVYQGDGHRCDVYVQHPNSGHHYRPELTVWIDVASQYIPGWWLAEDESAITTLYSLTTALAGHNHVPGMIHVDPGSGFKNKLIDDEVTGFLQRFGIESMHALPGNAKGKGLVEGLFRWFEERQGKKFDAYCGHCRTDDELSRLEFKVRKGLIKIPTFNEYRNAVANWVEWHNNTPKKSLGGKSPAELWEGLERIELHCQPEDLTWPQTTRTVRRWRVHLFNRVYQHEALASFNKMEVVVQYNLLDEQHVVIRDSELRFICEAELVSKADFATENRIEDLKQKRVDQQIQRQERHIEEKRRRSRPAIEHTDTLQAIENLSPGALEHDETNDNDTPHIDVFDVGYLDDQ